LSKIKIVKLDGNKVFKNKSDAIDNLRSLCHSFGISSGSIITLKKEKDDTYLVCKIEGKTVA
jgi:hypothetical protein